MSMRMLIDATHPEETRVVIVDGKRLEEFDFESANKKQLKGNIYLAKVIRIEPSLQAAFVEYGGTRHGFLSFSEIHPDYYQLPVADREALLAEPVGDEDDDESDESHGDSPVEASAEEPLEAAVESDDVVVVPVGDEENGDGTAEAVEVIGGEGIEEVARPSARPSRRYKIQEVIKRRQILLIQVVKEERGNKGAALTTYISLAGRYCVLMPNAIRGGGISRKISNLADRKRLKSIISELNTPEGTSVIVRTAGMERSKAEVKRDHEYLLRLWEDIRARALDSHAPALIHEEGNLIKRSIRDLYSRDTTDILVEGDEGYRIAKDFMRMLIPSHAKRVQPYKDPAIPLFQRYQVENQLDAIHTETVQLKSGGYLVINPTEALVAIDVNSGRSTRERNIEETAYRTNLEAAEEIPRQLRLRDLAGLIVIDFIDMEESRNNRSVEKCLKEAMKNDRARIQIGRISAFGLLELSRQRLRPSLVEASTNICPHCGGTGHVRSIESTALHVLRAVEEEGIRRRNQEIAVHVPTLVALYILNQKRDALLAIQQRHEMHILVHGDDSLVPPDYRIERTQPATDMPAIRPTADEPLSPTDSDDQEVVVAPEEKRGRRRRGRHGGSEAAPRDGKTAAINESPEATENDGEATPGAGEEASPGQDQAKRRRRGRRGGRRRRRGERGAAPAEGGLSETPAEGGLPETPAEGGLQEAQIDGQAAVNGPVSETVPSGQEGVSPEGAFQESASALEADAVDTPADEPSKPAPRRRRTRKTAASKQSSPESAAKPDEAKAPETVVEPTPEPARTQPSNEAAASVPPASPVTESPATESPVTENPVTEQAPRPAARKGWWKRVLE